MVSACRMDCSAMRGQNQAHDEWRGRKVKATHHIAQQAKDKQQAHVENRVACAGKRPPLR